MPSLARVRSLLVLVLVLVLVTATEIADRLGMTDGRSVQWWDAVESWADRLR